MVEVTIKSFEELHRKLQDYKLSNAWLFRGQGDSTWGLVPKAGRNPYKEINDETYFKSWKRRAREYTNSDFKNDWEWLALAQHHGLATRLLDWSINPLVACYFAVTSEMEKDGAIYAYKDVEHLDLDKNEIFGKYNDVGRVKPSAVTQRLSRQHGIFTIHWPRDLDMLNINKPNIILEKIVIPQKLKSDLQFDLSFYGINSMTIFPDLDGLSNHVNWHISNVKFWKQHIDLEDI